MQMEENLLAIPYLLRSVELAPEDVEAAFQYGIALAKSDMFEEAIDALERVLMLKPDDADALYNIGAAYLAWQGDLVVGKSYFEKAVESDEKHELAANALAAIQDLEASGE